MTKTIFIDGEAGTTGLRIKSLLAPYIDSGVVELLSIPHELRKDPATRSDFFNRADVSILCLPDEEAVKALDLITNPQSRVIDASSAHRTDAAWVFGFPEMSAEQADKIRGAKRVTNPGCYATGAIAILKPLVDAGIIARDAAPHIDGISGYSGGGNKLTALYEEDAAYAKDNALRLYALNAPHKHIPEIVKHAGLTADPVYTVATINAYQGMKVQTAFSLKSLGGKSIKEIHAVLEKAYAGDGHVRVLPLEQTLSAGDINFNRFAEYTSKTGGVDDYLDIHVTGWENEGSGQVTITAILDNLGKGAAGQAIRNMRLMLSV